MKLTTPMQITAADSESRTISGRIVHSMKRQTPALAKLYLQKAAFNQKKFF